MPICYVHVRLKRTRRVARMTDIIASIEVVHLIRSIHYNYTKYSTCVPMSHRFIVSVRTLFWPSSSSSLPFVSGTNNTTKISPRHEMHAYSHSVPCRPSVFCQGDILLQIFSAKPVLQFTYHKVDVRLHAYEATEVAEHRRNRAAHAAILERK